LLWSRSGHAGEPRAAIAADGGARADGGEQNQSRQSKNRTYLADEVELAHEVLDGLEAPGDVVVHLGRARRPRLQFTQPN
jgi:hypothetical protein